MAITRTRDNPEGGVILGPPATVAFAISRVAVRARTEHCQI
jgi:hypothetical protein